MTKHMGGVAGECNNEKLVLDHGRGAEVAVMDISKSAAKQNLDD